MCYDQKSVENDKSLDKDDINNYFEKEKEKLQIKEVYIYSKGSEIPIDN